MPYYHVRISLRAAQGASRDELALDLTEQQLEERFLRPYRQGLPITTRGRTLQLNEIEWIRINRTEEPSSELLPRIRAEQEARRASSGVVVVGGPADSWYVTTKGENVTDELITGPPGHERDEPSTARSASGAPEATRNVMIVHGRNGRLNRSLFDFLRSGTKSS